MAAGAIDFHTHTHPTAEEGTAFQRLWGRTEPERKGEPRELLRLMDEAGIAKAMIIPWMPALDHIERMVAEASSSRRSSGPAPRQGVAARDDVHDEVRRHVVSQWLSLNAWAVEAVEKHRGRLLTLVGLDPMVMDEATMRREAADKLAKGASGLKIAPMFHRCTPDDRRMRIVFDLAREHGVFVLAQAGGQGFKGAPAWGHPKHFEAVLKAYPGVDIVLAHLGIGAEEDVARLTAMYPNLYADTSSRLDMLGKPDQWTRDEAVAWFRRIGIDRVVFGTNYPLCDPVLFTGVMEALPLTASERAAILHENAERLLAGKK
ncbi:MAG: amidohydrolase family protein [Chloroflexi bacterium]|nr:amidohydrolase family protein [Chloroflexota bacterium]